MTSTEPVEQPSISELARRHGMSRQTIRRKLATGWQPPVPVEAMATPMAIPVDVEIVEQDQPVATLPSDMATLPATQLATLPTGHGRYVAIRDAARSAAVATSEPFSPNSYLAKLAEVYAAPPTDKVPRSYPGLGSEAVMPAVPTVTAPVTAAPVTTAHHGGSRMAAMALGLAAVLLGGAQLVIDAKYSANFGHNPVEAALLAAQGLGIGLAALMLPGAASLFARAGHRAWALTAWSAWLAFMALSTMAGLGFTAGGMGDIMAGRSAAIMSADEARAQRSVAVATLQRALDTATEARRAECAKRGPLCRDREADERAALTALNTAIAVPLPPLAAISAADPGGDAAAANIAWLTGIRVTAADVEHAWVLGRAIMPGLAGTLLAMAVVTWPRRRQRNPEPFPAS
jgi:hypothetical protein